MMSFVMLVTTIAPLMAPIVGGWVLVWLSWHYIFWILALAAILASAMIFFLIKEPYHRSVVSHFTFVPLLVTLRRCSVISVS